jgi:carboxypeptidase C (cathepsin A)
MVPYYDRVDFILNAGYQVVVYQGQFDILTAPLCTAQWVQQLTWPGLDMFNSSPKERWSAGGQVSGFRQNFENLTFWNILRAGHMVPMDAPEMAFNMMMSIVYPDDPSHYE